MKHLTKEELFMLSNDKTKELIYNTRVYEEEGKVKVLNTVEVKSYCVELAEIENGESSKLMVGTSVLNDLEILGYEVGHLRRFSTEMGRDIIELVQKEYGKLYPKKEYYLVRKETYTY